MVRWGSCMQLSAQAESGVVKLNTSIFIFAVILYHLLLINGSM